MTLPSRVWCHTVGCDKNLVDSEALLGRFAARGIAAARGPEEADIWVLNTCGFIAAARADSLDALRALIAAKGRGRRLVVTGCLAQERGAALLAEFPGIDLVAGVGNFDAVVDAALGGARDGVATAPHLAAYAGFTDRPLLTPPHVAFVKIAEGCDCRCAFCRIPLIRGPLRSRPPLEIAAEVEGLVARGVREIQLVSQNTSAYGRDLGTDLATLVARLDRIAGLRWIRLLYLFPGMTGLAEARRLLALPRVVPYLDLPIQHAAPALLRAMRRPPDAAATADLLLALRRERPELVLRTTVLLGFPGETEDDVEALSDFLARVEFDHLGAYRYSPEPGTPAAALPGRVPDEEVADREARILDLQAGLALGRQEGRLGEAFDAVVDAVVTGGSAAPLLESLRAGSWAGGWNPGRVPIVEGGPESVALARTWHHGYDLDGTVALPAGALAPGSWARVRYVAVTPFDALAIEDEAQGAGKGGAACEAA